MELKMKEDTAKRLYPESPEWFKEVLVETFGRSSFKRKYTEIKTFEDACDELGIDPDDVYNKKDLPDEIAFKKLKVIAKAINNGWVPNWNDKNQYKWFPYFNLSSGFGFSRSYYYCTAADSIVCSRLCFETNQLSSYVGQQFEDLYKDLLTITY
jgi:hypothetical protein